MKSTKSSTNGTAQVDEYMDSLDHPLKSEVQRVRELIKQVNAEVTEQVKWNAPSFSYRGEYLVTFNLRDRQRVHLVFHNPQIAQVRSSILEGDYPDRRMAYFAVRQDLESKRAALQKAVSDLVDLQKS